MVLDNYRHVAYRFTEPMAKRCPVGPNGLSVVAFFLAIMAGALMAYTKDLEIGKEVLLYYAILVLLSSLGDALDGQVARLKGSASKRGDLVDHTLDRVSDMFLLGGIAVSPYCNETVGFVGLLGVLLLSYMGTQAQALGVGRDYGGLLGRADRLVMLMIIPIVQYLMLLNEGSGQIVDRYLLEWMMVAFALIGIFTAAQRFQGTWKALDH